MEVKVGTGSDVKSFFMHKVKYNPSDVRLSAGIEPIAHAVCPWHRVVRYETTCRPCADRIESSITGRLDFLLWLLPRSAEGQLLRYYQRRDHFESG